MRITSRRAGALACAGALAGMLALPGSAFSWEAYMRESGASRQVWYERGGEANDVRITRASATSVRVADQGRYISSHWGWGGRYGCETASAPDSNGTYPATCTHPDGVNWVLAGLGDGADRLRIGASLPPIMVDAGADNDQVDVRDGNAGDRVECSGGLDWALVDPGDRADHCESFPLGGILTSGAAAASRGSGTLDVLARGVDHDLWVRTWLGTSWSGWSRVPGNGRLVGEPAVVSSAPGRLDVFVRGTDDKLYRTHFDGTAWTGYWEPLGGQLASAPAAVSPGGGRIDVFVKWADGTLRERFWDGSRWSDWVILDGQLASKPAAASSGYGRLDVFVRGTDNKLYQRSFDSSGWHAWRARGGDLTSAPSVASRANGVLDVVARGTDGQLYQLTHGAGSWGAWQGIGGDVAGVNADPALVAWSGGRLDAFVRVSDDSVYQLSLP